MKAFSMIIIILITMKKVNVKIFVNVTKAKFNSSIFTLNEIQKY
jgi:hypothetical protein